MQITVSGKHMELSDALRVHVARNLETITGKYFDHALEAHVTFGKARSFFTCDVNIHGGRGMMLRGEGEAADAHGAFDDAAEHLATRLRRYRRRMSTHARDLAQRARPEAARRYVLREQDLRETEPEPAELALAEAGAINGHDAAAAEMKALHATIVAEDDTSIELLTVSEAVMRMDLADQTVLMFRNNANGKLNVVYRRVDGHIGWIDPRG